MRPQSGTLANIPAVMVLLPHNLHLHALAGCQAAQHYYGSNQRKEVFFFFPEFTIAPSPPVASDALFAINHSRAPFFLSPPFLSLDNHNYLWLLQSFYLLTALKALTPFIPSVLLCWTPLRSKGFWGAKAPLSLRIRAFIVIKEQRALFFPSALLC